MREQHLSHTSLHKWVVLAEACLNIDRHNALIANFMDEAPNKCELD